ncbi:SLBP [Lepeophtheirus salmonis]|uniref:SLBP n=1 Tax=Lepeophtheirus salmonis TaxID=72036 RepID=A0A7R8CKV9_LEPSM|nr:SLBP [Lepeophtheirus salmonis]CAF2807885.1 SLBP [Lepeophtheirus salmonis]
MKIEDSDEKMSADSSACDNKRPKVNGSSSRPERKSPLEKETDPVILSRREKQIEYGKNTLSYDSYIEKIPQNLRKAHHPVTPKKHLKYSRRQWDGLVKAWKKRVHALDTETETPLPPDHKVNHHLKRKRKDWSSSNSRASSSLSLSSSKWPDEEDEVEEDGDATLTPFQEPDLNQYDNINGEEDEPFPFLPSKDS